MTDPSPPHPRALPDIYEVLTSLGIAYRRHDHAPVFTCDEAERAAIEPGAVQTKNLFLRDKRARRHVLFVGTCATVMDLKQIAARIDADNLSFASPERLARYLGVAPGAVTLLGLLHPGATDVEVVIDCAVWRAPELRCHPLVNTATLVLSHAGLETLLAHTGHAPRIVGEASQA